MGKYILKIYLSNWDLDYMIPKGISQTQSQIPNIFCIIVISEFLEIFCFLCWKSRDFNKCFRIILLFISVLRFRCDLEAGKDSYNPEELVCGGCSDVSQVLYIKNCHGYKCIACNQCSGSEFVIYTGSDPNFFLITVTFKKWKNKMPCCFSFGYCLP